MKGKNLLPKITNQATLCFRFYGEIQIFIDKKKIEEFIIVKPVLQQML